VSTAYLLVRYRQKTFGIHKDRIRLTRCKFARRKIIFRWIQNQERINPLDNDDEDVNVWNIEGVLRYSITKLCAYARGRA
jgi:hypothetical protein